MSTERLHSPGDLGAWLGERFPRLAAEPTERELAGALSGTERLQIRLRSGGRIARAIVLISVVLPQLDSPASP